MTRSTILEAAVIRLSVVAVRGLLRAQRQDVRGAVTNHHWNPALEFV